VAKKSEIQITEERLIREMKVRFENELKKIRSEYGVDAAYMQLEVDLAEAMDAFVARISEIRELVERGDSKEIHAALIKAGVTFQ